VIPDLITDLDPEDGYHRGEALCPSCRLTCNARLGACPTCQEVTA